MLGYRTFTVTTWSGKEMPVKKIAFFADKDQQGKVFYKIEGQNSSSFYMINFYYDRETAFEDYLKLLDALITSQVNNLQID